MSSMSRALPGASTGSSLSSLTSSLLLLSLLLSLLLLLLLLDACNRTSSPLSLSSSMATGPPRLGSPPDTRIVSAVNSCCSSNRPR
jgi:hypothetical protein